MDTFLQEAVPVRVGSDAVLSVGQEVLRVLSCQS